MCADAPGSARGWQQVGGGYLVSMSMSIGAVRVCMQIMDRILDLHKRR
jgi:hypothetical protein